MGFNPALSYPAGTLPAALASTAVGQGAALVGDTKPVAGAVGRTQHSINADAINVNDFGADPTGVTDSTSAIAIAILTAIAIAPPAPSGFYPGAIYFPAGTYKYSSLNASGLGAIYGAGITRTTLVPTGTIGITCAGGTIVEGINFKGASSANTCLYYGGANGYLAQIRECFFYNFGTAINFAGAVYPITGCTVEDNNFEACLTAVAMGTGAVTTFTFERNYMDTCLTGINFTAGSAQGVRIRDNVFNTFNVGLLIAAGGQLAASIIDGNWFESGTVWSGSASISGSAVTITATTSGILAIGQSLLWASGVSQAVITGGSGASWTINQSVGTVGNQLMTTQGTPYVDNTSAPGYYFQNSFSGNSYHLTGSANYGGSSLGPSVSHDNGYVDIRTDRASDGQRITNPGSNTNPSGLYPGATNTLMGGIYPITPSTYSPAPFTITTQSAITAGTAQGGAIVLNTGNGSNGQNNGPVLPGTTNQIALGSPALGFLALFLSGGISITTGSGAPGSNTPAIGSLYLNTAGGASTTLYVKTGATTWTAK